MQPTKKESRVPSEQPVGWLNHLDSADQALGLDHLFLHRTPYRTVYLRMYSVLPYSIYSMCIANSRCAFFHGRSLRLVSIVVQRAAGGGGGNTFCFGTGQRMVEGVVDRGWTLVLDRDGRDRWGYVQLSR